MNSSKKMAVRDGEDEDEGDGSEGGTTMTGWGTRQ